MKTFDRSFWIIFLPFLVVIGVILFFPYWFTQFSLVNFNLEKTGSIGDTLGGTMGPFIAIAAAILTFFAFWVQFKANEQQKLFIKKQRFEDNFFRLLDNHQRIVESMDLARKEDNDTIARSRDCFKSMHRSFIARNRNDNASKTDIDSVMSVYHNVQEEFKSDLHHYFRFLYHILKFIKNSDIEEEEKYRYSSILRASLSAYEIPFVFYNCLHEVGISHFKPLIEEFSFLKNIDKSLLLHISHKKKYDDLAFASSGDRLKLLKAWKIKQLNNILADQTKTE